MNKFNKAIVAVVMGVLYLLGTFFDIQVGLTEDQLGAVLAVCTPILVYFVPNAKD